MWTNSAAYGGRPGATAELVAVDRERLYELLERGARSHTADGLAARIVLTP